MNPTELLTLLSRTFPARLPTLTLGQPGIGKSDIHEQAAAVAGMAYRVVYPGLLDPTDLAGLPVPVGEGEARRVERLLDDVLADVVTAKDPTVVLLDELGAASPAMQAACAPLLLARRIGRHALPDHPLLRETPPFRAGRKGAPIGDRHLFLILHENIV